MKFSFTNFVRPRGTITRFESRSRHKLKRCSQFAKSLRGQIGLNEKISPPLTVRPRNDNKVSRDSAIFFVSEKGNLEKSETKDFLVYADKFSTVDNISPRIQ